MIFIEILVSTYCLQKYAKASFYKAWIEICLLLPSWNCPIWKKKKKVKKNSDLSPFLCRNSLTHSGFFLREASSSELPYVSWIALFKIYFTFYSSLYLSLFIAGPLGGSEGDRTSSIESGVLEYALAGWSWASCLTFLGFGAPVKWGGGNEWTWCLPSSPPAPGVRKLHFLI